jgi:hypothetical protein
MRRRPPRRRSLTGCCPRHRGVKPPLIAAQAPLLSLAWSSAKPGPPMTLSRRWRGHRRTFFIFPLEISLATANAVLGFSDKPIPGSPYTDLPFPCAASSVSRIDDILAATPESHW